MTKAIITQEELKSQLHYDQNTGIFTWKEKKQGRTANLSITPKRYLRIKVLNTVYLAHRLAWLYVYGEFPKIYIDHINRNPSDNRISNLRETTAMQNSQNMTKSNKPLNKVGVHSLRNGGYSSSIKVNSKTKWLGTFKTEEEAHQAYLIAKRELHAYCTI